MDISGLNIRLFLMVKTRRGEARDGAGRGGEDAAKGGDRGGAAWGGGSDAARGESDRSRRGRDEGRGGRGGRGQGKGSISRGIMVVGRAICRRSASLPPDLESDVSPERLFYDEHTSYQTLINKVQINTFIRCNIL